MTFNTSQRAVGDSTRSQTNGSKRVFSQISKEDYDKDVILVSLSSAGGPVMWFSIHRSCKLTDLTRSYADRHGLHHSSLSLWCKAIKLEMDQNSADLGIVDQTYLEVRDSGAIQVALLVLPCQERGEQVVSNSEYVGMHSVYIDSPLVVQLEDGFERRRIDNLDCLGFYYNNKQIRPGDTAKALNIQQGDEVLIKTFRHLRINVEMNGKLRLDRVLDRTFPLGLLMRDFANTHGLDLSKLCFEHRRRRIARSDTPGDLAMGEQATIEVFRRAESVRIYRLDSPIHMYPVRPDVPLRGAPARFVQEWKQEWSALGGQSDQFTVRFLWKDRTVSDDDCPDTLGMKEHDEMITAHKVA